MLVWRILMIIGLHLAMTASARAQEAEKAELGTRYLALEEIDQAIDGFHARNPRLSRIVTIGMSQEKRPIRMLVLENLIEPFRSRRNILVDGAHHGDEWPTALAVLAFAEKLVTLEQENPHHSLLRDFRYYLIPVVNPDGYRRVQRESAIGIDLNRDYPSPIKHDDAFQSQETKAMRELLQTVEFAASATLHSGAEGILWPWCHSSIPSADHEMFKNIAKKIAISMGYSNYMQSYEDYPSQGEFIDYAYYQHGIIPITLEISKLHRPNEEHLNEILTRSTRGLLTFSQVIKGPWGSPIVASSH